MMQISDCIQGSPEWFRLRAGIPTASEFSTVLAKGEDGTRDSSVTRKTYLMKLAGEIITGEPSEGYTNGNMERGRQMEDEARDFYAFTADAELQRVGFIRNGEIGCSPDSLIGDIGMVEFKTSFPHLLIPLLLKGEFPPKYKAQCQGNLWVSEREWIDICVFWPKMPMFRKRATRDKAYIAELAYAVDRFNAELRGTVERIRSLGGS